MPTTRKKQIKTVYKNSDSEEETGDFSDSGSEAKISEESSSEDDEEDAGSSSGDDFKFTKKKPCTSLIKRRPKFAKTFINKISKTSTGDHEDDTANENDPVLFSVKDLTDADKLLPSTLNLSESDSSDDESPKPSSIKHILAASTSHLHNSDGDKELNDYKDVFSSNIQENSADIAKKTFLELELYNNKIKETKASIQSYNIQHENAESDVKDLLALGEEVPNVSTQPTPKKKVKSRKVKDDSDSEMDDWEEVKEKKGIPAQGLQLIVDIPDSVCRKSKKIDVEMMMKRKINRVKKEHQVYMHKVHVLCWLGHGNYVSRVLNDQEILASALALVPSKECYPGERVDMKYLEQITTWYKDKIVLKQDKNEDKFRPKAPPLKEILTGQMKKKVATAKKYIVFIFIAMLRALGLQCRVMFNFVTLPIKPPVSELCSLSTKPKIATEETSSNENTKKSSKAGNKTNDKSKKNEKSPKIYQLDGHYDSFCDSDYENITQLDGNDDILSTKTRTTGKKAKSVNNAEVASKEDVSPPKRSRKSPSPIPKSKSTKREGDKKSVEVAINKKQKNKDLQLNDSELKQQKNRSKLSIDKGTQELSPRKTRNSKNIRNDTTAVSKDLLNKDSAKNKISSSDSKKEVIPKIVVTYEDENNVSSKFFCNNKSTKEVGPSRLSRKRSQTASPSLLTKQVECSNKLSNNKNKSRTKSAPGNSVEKSKYFSDSDEKIVESKIPKLSVKSNNAIDTQVNQRVSHRDLAKKRTKPKGDVTADLVNIIKTRVKEAKDDAKQRIVKGKVKNVSDEDSDFLPEEDQKKQNLDSDEDFKPTKISPKASTSRKPSTGRATHPVCYVVGWDNNNNLKDVTRRYVPHWSTATRKLRVDPRWWDAAATPWAGRRDARDREEDEYLDRMQLEAPLPKSISEYKNHPLYALKRHLLKYEAIYPPDAAALGFVRGEPVYSRRCVHTCRSRDTWLKEAKVVKLAEQPYKVVKARPKWDRLSNKLITDKPLEVFGPWQVQDYEPPSAENGIVPRNAYGNVELFKDCMLPKGTVHINLPGLNKVCKKLNVDCAPAMTGFDFNGGWSHPVYSGFVVCQEFQQLVTDAWHKDQEEQERREIEKMEARVYGNWRRLIRGLFIRERLKCKYGFEEPTTSQETKKKVKAPRLVVKKK
ncbi:DNA repair protein complementing XP-C cells homolog isoform X2 [Plodia interpunctella]|uniref:DNA repair protein complementing XP-C cells homolog isoform X2 n=1 Tax=Plodia interpunctella TaxID=58824 RepID=UPI002368C719|nr:DNA repair protein complementing XP-C cells homolog isoform X2 [Plodia interpunctella]